MTIYLLREDIVGGHLGYGVGVRFPLARILTGAAHKVHHRVVVALREVLLRVGDGQREVRIVICNCTLSLYAFSSLMNFSTNCAMRDSKSRRIAVFVFSINSYILGKDNKND